jgi:hypothetical protein
MLAALSSVPISLANTGHSLAIAFRLLAVRQLPLPMLAQRLRTPGG